MRGDRLFGSHFTSQRTSKVGGETGGLVEMIFDGDPNHVIYIRRDRVFLVFSFPRSLGSGVYDAINGGHRKLGAHLFETISHQILKRLERLVHA